MHTDRRIINTEERKRRRNSNFPVVSTSARTTATKLLTLITNHNEINSQNNLQSAGVRPRHIKQLFLFILISLSVFFGHVISHFSLFYLAQSIFDVRAWQRHREHVEKENEKFIELEPLATFYCVLIMTVNAVCTHQKKLNKSFSSRKFWREMCNYSQRRVFSLMMHTVCSASFAWANFTLGCSMWA